MTWPRETCCIGHEKPPWVAKLRRRSCLELQIRGAPCALCPGCALLLIALFKLMAADPSERHERGA
jgi:hypothetical protein